MASLRECFEKWGNGEPDELGDRPTDQELEEHEAEEKAHTAMVRMGSGMTRCLQLIQTANSHTVFPVLLSSSFNG